MNLNQPSLVAFETERSQNHYIPLEGSNAFYNIGGGEINIYTINSNNECPSFNISTNKSIVETGKNFSISGDPNNSNNPYRNLTVIADTTLRVSQSTNGNINILTISGDPHESNPIEKVKTMEVHGTLELMPYSQIFVRNNAHLILYSDSIFKINNNTNILVEKGSSVTIYGQINVQLSRVDSILNVEGINIDSAAVMNVEGIDKKDRPYSLSDYETDLRDRIINIHTQGETNSSYGRMGYTWTAGDPREFSQVIMMSVLWGESILGDFKLSALGLPETIIPNNHMVSDIKVSKGSTLYIQEEYRGMRYIRPELYIGLIINNNNRPGNLIIDGTIVCDGVNSRITVDRGAAVYINRTGTLILRNQAIMRSTHNDANERILFIDGTLIIDDTSQIDTFTSGNIVFGEKGKVIILNPDTGEKRILFTTPDGIHNTTLYRLFEDSIDHIEYHVSNNTGIKIDKYYEFFSRDMTKWFGNRRIEKAIHDGILVWHDGGFIELNNDIIPWADEKSTLLQASRLFKSFGSYDDEKLQEVANRLKYAGSGNIVFRFVKDNRIREVTLVLNGVNMQSVINRPMTDLYNLKTNGSGELFLRNKLARVDSDHIIDQEARLIHIEEDEIDFQLS